MRVLCVALWRTRPSVLFVLEARFSLPIDRTRTPCFNANPHCPAFPPFAIFPPADRNPSPPPQHPSSSSSSSLPSHIISLSCIMPEQHNAIEILAARGYLDGQLPLTPFEKSMFHQSSDVPARGGRFFRPGVSRSIDPRATGNWRPPVLTTWPIDSATANR